MAWLSDILPNLRAMPVFLKLPTFGLGIVVLWWILWGKTGIGKAKEVSNSGNSPTITAPDNSGNIHQNSGQIGVQNNPQINIQSGASPNISIGGTLTVNNISQPQGSDIDNTVYSTAQLKKAFPLGYVVLRRNGESDWSYTPDTRDIFKWDNPPTIEVRPNFATRKVEWAFKNVNVTFVAQNGHFRGVNAERIYFPMEVGRVFDWALIVIPGYPVIHVVTLNDDQLKFTCAFGFREPTGPFQL